MTYNIKTGKEEAGVQSLIPTQGWGGGGGGGLCLIVMTSLSPRLMMLFCQMELLHCVG